eukprot:TRINITY_DN40240_c0_g1_i1.p1 TRINITY_DN40240_c0_g1~~TRINITY_DN40240_c0_g1_i1.p1  ORF type:complete len:160 (-),score=54.92 TRINITY_DN40240_c0_g1_i1:148-627(-)
MASYEDVIEISDDEDVIDLEEKVSLKESNGRMDNKKLKRSFKEKADCENTTGDDEIVEVRIVSFQIKCNGMSTAFPFRVLSDTPIGSIKKMFARKAGMAFEDVSLYFNKKRISDEQTPLDLNIKDGDMMKAKRVHCKGSGLIVDGPAQETRRPLSIDIE